MSFLLVGIAGVLALPSLLISVATIPIVAILSIPAVSLLLSRKIDVSKNNDTTTTTTKDTAAVTKGIIKQVVVTGGSSGIGLEIAKEAARKSDISKIYIIARNTERLEAAKKDVIAVAESNKLSITVEILSVDVSSFDALKDSAKHIMTSNSVDKEVVTTYLFCCAGEPFPHYYEDVTNEMFTSSIGTNLLGQIYATNAFIPYFKEQNDKGGGGTITFCSSACGLLGLFGYTAYCPPKFGVRGFAEVLFQELLHYKNIHVQIAFPSDTQTPGFDKENMTKPVECQLLAEGGGCLEASDVGKTMYAEATAKNPKFFVYFNFEGFVMCTLGAGFGPVTNMFDAVMQVSASNLLRFVAIFYYGMWRGIIKDYKMKSTEEKVKLEAKLFPNRKVTKTD